MNPLRCGVLAGNERLGAVLVHDLAAVGVAAELHADPRRLIGQLRSSPPSLVVLETCEGPEEAALRALRQIRALSRIPCVVVGARVDPENSVGFLEAGADDLMPRGTPVPTMLARMRAVLRRGAWGPAATDGATAAAPPLPAPDVGPAGTPPPPPEAAWRLLRARRELCRPDGSECRLTTAEFDLFCLLVELGPRAVSREAICREVFRRRWRAEDRTVDNLVVRLRRKLDDPGRTTIRTVQGQGYAFVGFPEAPLHRL